MKNNKWILVVLGVVLIAILVYLFNLGLFNNSVSNSQNSNKVRVSASFYPLYFFSSQIGGDKAIVSNMTPAGAEPHDYDPSTQEIAKIEEGDILILNGGVEAWGDKIKDNLKGSRVRIITAGDGIINKRIVGDGEMRDFHFWLDPKLAKQEVEKITDGYIKIDPNNADYYKENERILNARLDQLDLAYKMGLKSCKSRDIITSHAAFAYLAKAYDLRQIPISGVSPDEEPSAKQLAGVVNFVNKNNVKYIFFETLVSPKLSETIANEVGAKTMVLDPIEGISDDNIKQGKNYFTVMEDNLKNLQIALQCSN